VTTAPGATDQSRSKVVKDCDQGYPDEINNALLGTRIPCRPSIMLRLRLNPDTPAQPPTVCTHKSTRFRLPGRSRASSGPSSSALRVGCMSPAPQLTTSLSCQCCLVDLPSEFALIPFSDC
jgi:hypothetical protein